MHVNGFPPPGAAGMHRRQSSSGGWSAGSVGSTGDKRPEIYDDIEGGTPPAQKSLMKESRSDGKRSPKVLLLALLLFLGAVALVCSVLPSPFAKKRSRKPQVRNLDRSAEYAAAAAAEPMRSYYINPPAAVLATHAADSPVAIRAEKEARARHSAAAKASVVHKNREVRRTEVHRPAPALKLHVLNKGDTELTVKSSDEVENREQVLNKDEQWYLHSGPRGTENTFILWAGANEKKADYSIEVEVFLTADSEQALAFRNNSPKAVSLEFPGSKFMWIEPGAAEAYVADKKTRFWVSSSDPAGYRTRVGVAVYGEVKIGDD